MRKTLLVSLFGLALAITPVLAADKMTVRNAQQALKDKGYDPGPVDGIYGPATRAAMKQYQDKQNLNEDGKLGPKTMDSLGIAKAGSGTQFKKSGEQVKNGYGDGGKDFGHGGAQLGRDIKHGDVGGGAVEFGKGVGHGSAQIGKSTGHAAVSVGKGVKNAVDPPKKSEQPQ